MLGDRSIAPLRYIFLANAHGSFVGDPTKVAPGQYVTAANFTMYPYSRGHVHITGQDVEAPLDFNLGFFTDEYNIDLRKLVWAYKKTREVFRRTKFYRGEHEDTHPEFAKDSPAALVHLDAPLFTTEAERKALPDIVYGPADDAAIVQFLREVTETTWHSLGTNKMAPRAAKGVVDENLNVYGVTSLKVIDLSIAPGNVAANTNNTAMVIGEKGADIIARELGLVLSEGPLV